MMIRNSTALLICLSVIKLTCVTAFSPTRIPQNSQVSQAFQLGSDRSSAPLHATSYDQEDGFTSTEESEISPEEKKEKVSQIMVVAVGAFFTYSIIAVAMSTASFVGGSMSQAFDIGNIANFAGSVLGTVAGATWSGLKVAAPVVGKGVISAGQAAAPYVQEASQKVSEVATPYVQEAAQRVSEAASPVVEQAAQAVSEAASPYVSAADSAITSATSAVTSTIDATVVAPIKEATTSVVSTVDSTVKATTDSVVSAVDSTVKATTDSVVTAVDSSLKEATSSVSSTLKGVTNGAVESIKQASPF